MEQLTKNDLEAFEQRVITAISNLLFQKITEHKKKWLTTIEVKQEFCLSQNTIKKHFKPQQFNGKGKNYYSYTEIISHLSK